MNGKIDYDREFTKESFGQMVDSLNTILNSLLLGNNMSGQVVENILLPLSGAEVSISHNLKSVPKYKIILRNRGDGIIADSETPWNDKSIYLRSHQATEDIIVSVLIMRG